MKIDFLCVQGSPMGQTMKTVWGADKYVGVGGSELYMLTLCEEWAKAGHQVRLYNDPREFGASPFEQLEVRQFNPDEDRDAVIGFRVIDHRFAVSKGLKVWLSCDQRASGDFNHVSKWADKIVCISPFHQEFFRKTYDIHNSIYIDIPVRVDDYEVDYPKISKRCLFSSVPDRGLDILAVCWPKIVEQVPDASLVITADYRLWNSPYPGNDRHRKNFMEAKNVQFLGAVPRKRLIQEQLQAEVMPYSCIYDELFCISVAEAQYAGCYPITSDMGALETTNMGCVIPGDPRHYAWMDSFISNVVLHLQMSEEEKKMRATVIHKAAEDRFSPDKILEEWEVKVFNG